MDMRKPRTDQNKKSAKESFLLAAIQLIRTKGYSAATLDELCDHAGFTKGTFFHYFESKEDLAVSAAQRWSQMTGQLFSSAPYHKLETPFERLIGYIELRKELLRGEIPDFTCLVGTMVQEIYANHPKIQIACKESIYGHAETLEKDIQELKRKYHPKAKWTAKSLALYTQATIQGAFILAKSGEGSPIAMDMIDHLENYFILLFEKHRTKNKRSK